MSVAVDLHDRNWSLVLAGGEGERLRPLTERWLGRHVPKQYCAFTGQRSMLQHTLDRAERVSGADRTVALISRSHERVAAPQLAGRRPDRIVLQPSNRDTAAGIFLGLSYIRRRDPGATVAIFPSDHFIFPEQRFVRLMRHMLAASARMKDRLLLLGVTPDTLELDYGWIEPGESLGRAAGAPVRAVSAFLEKPGAVRARSARRRGALWNTFVMAARLETIWQLGWRWVPEIMPFFDQLTEAIGTRQEPALLEAIYRTVPKRSFSSDLLQRASADLAVVPMEGVLWSDWGRPDRIEQTLLRIGRTPAFATVGWQREAQLQSFR